MRSFWAAALVISGALSSAPCEAKDTDLELTISRGDLADALSSLAIQAGVSLGYVSPIPAVAVKGFHTRSSAAHALDRLLRDTPLQAERVGPATFRIIARRRITLSEDIGRIEVVVPDGVEVIVEATIDGAGQIDVFDRTADGLGPSLTAGAVNDPAKALTLDLTVGIGAIEVTRS